MQIQILKENFVKGLQITQKYTAQKGQVPVLSYLLIEATSDGIFISATDLETGIRLRVAGKVIEEGAGVIPAKMVGEFVGVLPLGVVELTLEATERLWIKAAGMEASFQALLKDEFPGISIPEKESEVGVIKLKDWSRIWGKLEFAVSRDLARPVLTGILWDLPKGRLVATDGYRLSVVDLPQLQFGGIKKAVIVNGAFWGLVTKTMEEAAMTEARLFIDETRHQVVLVGDGGMMTGRLIEGEYPNYQAIMPQESESLGQFDREIMLQAVRGAMIFARDSAQIVKFEFTKENLEISAATQQGGAKATLGRGEVGSELVAAFNGRFVMDFLTHATAAQIEIQLRDPLKPGKFMEVGTKDCQHVIMPIRLKQEEE